MNKLKTTLLVLCGVGVIPIPFLLSVFGPLSHPFNAILGIIMGGIVFYFGINKILQKGKFRFIWILLIIITLPQVVYMGYRFYSVPASREAVDRRIEVLKDLVGKALPEFEMIDMNGNPFSSKQLLGNNVIINLWATWCEPCMKEIPYLNELYKNHRDEGLIVVGISLEQIKNQKSFIEKHELKYTFLKENIENEKGIFGYLVYPTNFFVDMNGVIQTIMIGFKGEEDLIINANDLLSK